MTVHFDTLDRSDECEYKVGEFSGRGGAYSAFGKRAADIVLVLLAAPIFLPLMVLFALLLVACGHKPFFKQERIGLNGRVFVLWKFRTMVEDAEAALTRFLDSNPDARAEWDVHQKLKSDPRVTAVGRVLRKTSMDELPQLWNVLNGTMSLVGPRPMLPQQQALYPSHVYYRLRPGITGYWQVSERNEGEFKARATFDTLYERELSIRTDIAVLWQTVAVVLRGTGY